MDGWRETEKATVKAEEHKWKVEIKGEWRRKEWEGEVRAGRGDLDEWIQAAQKYKYREDDE